MSTMDKEKREEFEQLSRPLLKWLCENRNPHVKVIITPTRAELVEGSYSTGEIFDYVRD